jgi:hypothetical protein
MTCPVAISLRTNLHHGPNWLPSFISRGSCCCYVELTAAGFLAQHQAAASNASNASASQLADHSKAIPFYVSALVIDWALFCYCYIGVRWNGGTLSTLSGGRWQKPKEILIDIMNAALFWVIWEGTAYGTHFLLDRLFPGTKVAAVDSLLPRSWNEIALWIILCVSAGICEEVIPRLPSEAVSCTNRECRSRDRPSRSCVWRQPWIPRVEERYRYFHPWASLRHSGGVARKFASEHHFTCMV